jgi:hypothetical protein
MGPGSSVDPCSGHVLPIDRSAELLNNEKIPILISLLGVYLSSPTLKLAKQESCPHARAGFLAQL